MVLELDAPVRTFLVQDCHFWASAWELLRKDGTVFHFTDHNHRLVLPDGQEYSPLGGIDVSAQEHHTGLKDTNLDALGVLSDDRITNADLRAGKYREAKLIWRLVDWRFPFAGVIREDHYWIRSTEWTGTTWRAELEGLTRFIKQNVGRVVTRNCRHILGGAFGKPAGTKGCTVDLAALEVAGVVNSVSFKGANKRGLFRTDLVEADKWWQEGELTWTTGANTGENVEIRTYKQAGGQLALVWPTAHDIAPGDAFAIRPGCNKLLQTCIGKFANVPEYGGFPWMPGTDTMIRHPDPK